MGASGGIPAAEVERFQRFATEAVRLARRGRALEGCGLLEAGLERAEMFRRAGVPWGERLADYYRRALVIYRGRYTYVAA